MASTDPQRAKGDGSADQETSASDNYIPRAAEFDEGDESNDSDEEQDEDEDDDEDETEPLLKYSNLTSYFAAVYRNGDSTSAFMASGGYVVVGTNSGKVHVYTASTMQLIRSYHYHRAAITAISVSPLSRRPLSARAFQSSASRGGTSSPNSPLATAYNMRKPAAAATLLPIHVATSSLDGLVCVFSLANSDDIIQRNYARPLQAVSVSPDFKSDRTFLTGGPAGQLILTVGGKMGVRTDATISGPAAAASGWLGSLGVGHQSGTDTVLHSGEGSILAIAWSLSGKYLAWVNEKGIKIMRTNLHLDNNAHHAWKRIGHVDRPERRIWQDMAGRWKPKLHWIDRNSLEDRTQVAGEENRRSPTSSTRTRASLHKEEELMVGWGDAIWLIKIQTPPGISDIGTSSGMLARPDRAFQLWLDDGIVSDLLLFSHQLLMALVFRTKDDNDRPLKTEDEGKRRGIRRHRNALPPDIRMIDIRKDFKPVDIAALSVSSHQGLSSTDYHMSSLFIPEDEVQPFQSNRAFETIGNFLEVSRNATRIFSSGTSVISGLESEKDTEDGATKQQSEPPNFEAIPQMHEPGLKILIHSPYDSVLATNREASDRLAWLMKQHNYAAAWKMISQQPSVVIHSAAADESSSRGSSPTPSQHHSSLKDFLSDDAMSIKTAKPPATAIAEQEKRKIGDLWIRQLIKASKWHEAAEVVDRVVNTTQDWNKWLWMFIEAEKFDELLPVIPRTRQRPALSTAIYDTVLSHYVGTEIAIARRLLDSLDDTCYDHDALISAFKKRISTNEVKRYSEDWNLIHDSIAMIHMIDMRPADAFRNFVNAGNADAAIALVRDYQLLDIVAEDIWSFLQLEQDKDNDATYSKDTSGDDLPMTILLLAMGAMQNLIPVLDAVDQLKANKQAGEKTLFLFFKALWTGADAMSGREGGSAHGPNEATSRGQRQRRFDPRALNTRQTSLTLSRSLLAPFGNEVIKSFASFSRSLLSEVIRAADEATRIPYDFNYALDVCHGHGYTSEIVYILSATGRTKEALQLIIDEIGNVKQAIDFAREIDDPSVWEDLVSYSMGHASFILGLLENGLSMNAGIPSAMLVRRIPEKTPIPGLKNGLLMLLHENEVQYSVALGAAKILNGEFSTILKELFDRRAKGAAFEMEAWAGNSQLQSKHCALCDEPLLSATVSSEVLANGHESLVARFCGCIVHLSCQLDAIMDGKKKNAAAQPERELHDVAAESLSGQKDYGSKMTRAMKINELLEGTSCLACKYSETMLEQV